MQLDASGLSYYAVNGQMVAPEGPRSIPLLLDFTQTTDYEVNLQNQQARAFISMVQAVFVDNSANASPLTVTMPDSGQSIIVAPGHQGYYNVICPNPARISFSTTGDISLAVFLLNYPVTNADWPTSN